jgi:hypothetical protein
MKMRFKTRKAILAPWKRRLLTAFQRSMLLNWLSGCLGPLRLKKNILRKGPTSHFSVERQSEEVDLSSVGSAVHDFLIECYS